MYQLLKTEARAHRDQMPPRRLRHEGYVPGVIYGKGMDSVPFRVALKDWKRFYQRAHSKVFEVEVEGSGRHLVSLENIQKDHLGTHVLHLEFHHLDQTQETVITLPVRLKGEAIGVKGGGVVSLDHHEFDVKGLPKDFPDYIEVDISNLEVNESIHLSDITPPPGLRWMDDGDTVVAHCSIPRMKVEETPAAEAPAEAAVQAESDEQKEAS